MTIAAGVGAREDAGTGWRERSIVETLQRFAPFIVIAIVFGVAASVAVPYPVGVFHDDGVYLILGKAIATGQGYRYLHIPGAPIATHYPPAYPLLLALLWKIAPDFPANIPLLLIVNAALLAAAAWCLERFGRVRLGWPPWLSASSAVVGTLSLPLLLLSSVVMSEVLFIALVIPLLSATERALNETIPDARDIALGAAAGALTLVRTHAIALPLAMIALLLWRRHWARAAWYAGSVVLVLFPWQLWIVLHNARIAEPLQGAYGSYLGWYAAGVAKGGIVFLWRTVTTNLLEVTGLIADRIAPWPAGWLRILLLSIGIDLLLVGCVRLWRRGPVLLAFLGFYLAATLAWPYAPWRFLFAIWPLVLVLGVEGALWLRGFEPRWPKSLSRAAPVATILLLAIPTLGIAYAELTSYRERAWRTPVVDAQRRIGPIIRWVSQHTAPSDAVVADDEPLVYLMTGRRAVPPAPFTALEYVGLGAPNDSAARRSIRTLVEQYHPRYVLTILPSTREAARALTRDPRPLLREVAAPASGARAVFEPVP